MKKSFIIETLNGMAYGLFSTLIVGTIINTFSLFFKSSTTEFGIFIYTSLVNLSYILQNLTGVGIGIGIALVLKYNTLKTIIIGVAGEIASFFSLSLTTDINQIYIVKDSFKIGDPLTIYFVCIALVLLINLIFKKPTPVDIIIIPLFGSIIALILSILIRYPAIFVTYGVQYIVNISTNTIPFISGIIIAVVMGMALTAPISSAAIAYIVFSLPSNISYQELLSNPQYSGIALASGAAIVGCSCQMIGFAIESIKDNNIGKVISIGIGTSMLQFKNIIKKPILWFPTIIASAILGPISTCLVKTVCTGANAGMGTAGLVGQIGTILSMGVDNPNTWISIIILQIIAPGVLVFFIDLLFRKLNLIKKDDLTI